MGTSHYSPEFTYCSVKKKLSAEPCVERPECLGPRIPLGPLLAHMKLGELVSSMVYGGRESSVEGGIMTLRLGFI